jgi:hypothetical protein
MQLQKYKMPIYYCRKGKRNKSKTQLTTKNRDIKYLTSYENSVLKYNTIKLIYASSLFSVIYHWGQ